MKRMFLSLVLLSGISLQAVDTGSNKDSQENEQVPVSLFGMNRTVADGEEVDPLSFKKAYPNWRRSAYLLPFMFIPGMISYATANSKYRFAGPLSATVGWTIAHRRLNKADRGVVHPFWTHSAWVPPCTALVGSYHILFQSILRNDGGSSLGQMLSHYFDLKR